MLNQASGKYGPLEPRSESKSSLAFLLLAVVLLLALLIVGVAFQQSHVYRQQAKFLEDQIAETKIYVGQIRSIGRDLLKVEREMALLEKKVQQARTRIPRTLETDSFLADFAQWTRKSGLSGRTPTVEEDLSEPLQKAIISAQLKGNRVKVAQLCQGRELKRRIYCLEQSPVPGGVALKFEIFALPDSAQLPSSPSKAMPQTPPVCAEPEKLSSGVWLPPWSEKISRSRRQLNLLCKEGNDLAPTLAKIEEFKQMKQDLQQRLEIMENPQNFKPDAGPTVPGGRGRKK